MNRKVVPVAAAVVAIAAITTLTAVRIASPVQCQPDPSAQIAALPAGGTFTGSGCYTVPNGIRLTKSVTLDGGTYIDPSNAKPAKGGFRPVIQVYDTSGVVLENLTIQGGDPTGAYHAPLVNQSGIDLISSSNVTIANDSISQTFGDGLELWTNGGPNTDVVVTGLSINNVGRNGISPSDVANSTFTGVRIGNTGLTGVDFESDINNIGAGYVTISNSSWNGTYIQEALSGPISFVDDSLSGHIVMTVRTKLLYPITFSAGKLAIGHWTRAGVFARGPGAMVFNGTTFTHQLGKAGLLWDAGNGASLTFAHCALVPPLGVNDSTSTVTVIP